MRQAYTRLGKRALIKHQRYAHARHFKRARRQLRQLKTQLGRVMRDIGRKIASRPELNAALGPELFRAGRVLIQERGQGGRKLYSLHAPEVECIGKGKAHKPYEFGVKVSVATTLAPSKGGQFVLQAMALPPLPRRHGSSTNPMLRTSGAYAARTHARNSSLAGAAPLPDDRRGSRCARPGQGEAARAGRRTTRGTL